MQAELIDGKKLAQSKKTILTREINAIKMQGGRAPGLAVILIGSDAASQIYVQHKRRTCEEVGMYSLAIDLPAHTTQAQLDALIDELNQDQHIDGILIQLPLPEHLNTQAVLEHIDPGKDVDGFHPFNLGKLAQRQPFLRPCTPKGVISLLNAYQIDLHGLDAVVVGASNIVGRPMALELLLAGATVTICHRFTKNLQTHVQRADLLVVAVGQANFITGDWIKSGAIVIDIGINRLTDGRLTGDIDFQTAKEKARLITPVPGGVGPMTVISLLENTLLAYQHGANSKTSQRA